jgi:hypothetical protein
MKKLILALLVIAFLPGIASAIEVAAWEWEGDWATGNWVTAVNGRCFAVNPPPPESTYCNKDWHIDVGIHAEIAQWVKWNLTGRDWHWFIRKPGNYGADCITATLWSNQDVLVHYHDFGPLVAVDTGKAVNDTIWIWYAIDDGIPEPWGLPPPKSSDEWVRADSLNLEEEWDTVEDCQQLHDGVNWKLWNYVHIENCHSACKYEDVAWIGLKLKCQKAWIDTSTGGWIPGNFFP